MSALTAGGIRLQVIDFAATLWHKGRGRIEPRRDMSAGSTLHHLGVTTAMCKITHSLWSFGLLLAAALPGCSCSDGDSVGPGNPAPLAIEEVRTIAQEASAQAVEKAAEAAEKASQNAVQEVLEALRRGQPGPEQADCSHDGSHRGWDCSQHDACIVYPICSRHVALTAVGVDAGISVFEAGAIRGMENAAVRAFNATRVCSTCGRQDCVEHGQAPANSSGQPSATGTPPPNEPAALGGRQ